MQFNKYTHTRRAQSTQHTVVLSPELHSLTLVNIKYSYFCIILINNPADDEIFLHSARFYRRRRNYKLQTTKQAVTGIESAYLHWRLKKNLNASRPSEHPPARGENVRTFRWDHRLQIQNLFMASKRVVVTLGQQHNTGEIVVQHYYYYYCC